VTEGYGMTESSCVISCIDDGDVLSGHVGSPNPACGEYYKFHILYLAAH
jgi:long-chain acyl-CoA synthetase